MSATATGPWTCDVCNGVIERVEDGWVEWITIGDTNRARDLRLVHHMPASPRKRGCQFNEDDEYSRDNGIVSDLPLSSFVGADGLTQLLMLIDEGELPSASVIEMIKRLHTPQYEQARLHIDRAVSAGVFEPNLRAGFHWQRDLRNVLRFVRDERGEDDDE